MKSVLRKSPFFLLALACSSVAGYSFHFIASRCLGPARYGEYTVLMALMLAFARPLESLSPVVARTMVENQTQDWKSFLRSFFYVALFSGLILGGALFIFAFFWGSFLNISSSIAIPFASLTLIFWSFLYVFRGILQGHFRDVPYIFNRPLELLGRLLSGSLFFALGGGLASAIFSSLLGALSGVFHVFLVIKHSFSNWTEFFKGKADPNFFKQFLKIMLIWLAGGFFIGLDMILVKRLFPARDCGLYAIANLIGKGVLVYAVAILPVLFPRLVKHRLSKESLRYLGFGMLYSAGVFLAAFFIFFFWGDSIIPFFFGEAYKGSAGLVPLYLLAIFPISLHFVIINLKSAIGDWGECVFLWFALGFYFLVLFYSPHKFSAYLWRIGISQVMCAAAGFLFLLVRERSY